MSDTPASAPQLKRQPRQVVRNVHRLDSSGREAALNMLDVAQLDYRRIMDSLQPHERGFIMAAGWQARAELFRRIASRQKIID